MSELVLEVGTEEIPARLAAGARSDLAAHFRTEMQSAGLDGGLEVLAEATPRRLVLFASGLRSRQAECTVRVKGPAKAIAFDTDASPTKAGLGFARRVGLPVEAVPVDPKDGKLYADQIIEGRSAAEVLVEALPTVVGRIKFPRSMYWTGPNGPRFIRPIRWLLALLDGEVVPFEIAGLQASNATWGHRRLGSGRLAVHGPEEFRRALAENGVVLSAEERGSRILDGARSVVPEGFRIRPNKRLLQTLVYETECPTAIHGEFDEQFLQLPDEVLSTVMLVHQKYFAVEDEGGAMTNRFVAIANTQSDATGVIRRGHERVLRARFNDARFFWDFDLRQSLEERRPSLANVTFQADLGSYADKTDSSLAAVDALVAELGPDADTAAAAYRAAQLAKCDLTTEMVGEFPELQGRVGGLYASAGGESAAVADAIYDHYLPAGSSGPIPRSLAGRIVALADRLTTLGGMFGIGLMPTGSRDPLALRRAALGVVRIVVEGDLPIGLSRLVQIAGAGESAADLRAFLRDRLQHWLEHTGGIPADVVQAVLTASDDAPTDTLARARAVAAVRATADIEALAVSFKRIRNILASAGGADRHLGAAVDVALFSEEAETALHEKLQAVRRRITATEARGSYEESLRSMAELRPALDRYFVDVLVIAEDRAVRNNRLAFLASVQDDLSTIADFTAIVVEGETA